MVLHIVWCYVFVSVFNMEYKGVAVATSITYFSNFLLLTVYLSKSTVISKESWHFINRDSFKGWYEYLHLGIPSMLMLCLEAWCF